MKKTALMRVPCDFKDEVFKIAKKKSTSALNLLATSGVKLFQNADFLTEKFLGGYSKRKTKR